jgi:hypothetical protein
MPVIPGRNQEDHGLKPAWANSSQDHNLETSFTKKGIGAGGVAQGEGPEFKLSTKTHKFIAELLSTRRLDE